MSRGRSSVVFLGLAAAATVGCPLAAGCIVADGDEQIVPGDAIDVPLAAATTTGDPDDPPVGHNPFYPECFWNHGTQQTYRDLANGPLSNAGFLPAMPHMALTAIPTTLRATCREQALRYLVQCALTKDTTVKDGNNASYTGHYGIAPEWRTGPLSSTNKEWITSCLTQHLNGFNTTTMLVLEGHRLGYVIDTVPTGYPIFDTITWGNLFTSTTPLDVAGWNSFSRPAFTSNVCFFDDIEQGCDMPSNAVEGKFCGGLQTTCGHVDRGNCKTACTWATSDGLYTPQAYWRCDGKSTNFRERLPSLAMYTHKNCD